MGNCILSHSAVLFLAYLRGIETGIGFFFSGFTALPFLAYLRGIETRVSTMLWKSSFFVFSLPKRD
ncbi:hypothetical protein TTE2651 [Caldanaerobacter subterraneus subsp. tengcongensis MB4]|uniref:Uncharacterized protein n=1 Tax=Caldanaerobacter subterraneus subsp. tengcongensis (strain DSM 15242 / JCM 11007 / NBRC 100824 / MB4) TaxID=273068 RepID=Q8R6Y2_CALS4|nr:hypothetical protein TTE2651 [Caldanaerobacter subterraneus subsp. tengcongensis MB4]